MSTLGLDIEGAVEALLKQNTDIAAALYGQLSANSTSQGWRIFPDQLMQGCVLPALVFFEVSDMALETTDGPGLETSRVQIDVYSPRRLEALQILTVVDRCLCPRLGSQVGLHRYVRVGDELLNVQGIRPDVRRSGYEQATKLYRRGRDYHVTASSV